MTLARILVATDFSAGAECALERALRLPLATGARFVLLHVAPDALDTESEARARELLAALVTRTARPGVEIVPELAVGAAYEQIIHHARVHDVQLVVLGRRGTRNLRDRLLGSTADRVIRYGDLPVLVVAASPRARYQRPLVATGLDDTAGRLLQLASSVVEPDVTATVMHSYHVPFGGLPYLIEPPIADEDVRSRARRVLDELLARFPELRSRGVLRRGEASSSVLLEQLELDADLVVLGTHARSGLAHVLLGSVAERVLASVPCDVLIARPVRFAFALP